MGDGSASALEHAGAVRGIRILDERGGFSAPMRVSWSRGVYRLGGEERSDGEYPGEAHSHPSGADGERVDAARADGVGTAGAGTAGQPARELDAAALSAAELWLIPGIVDAHLHAAWHAFDAADRARLSEERTLAATARSLALTLAAGVTSARDAGGLTPGMLRAIPPLARPRMQLSVRIIDRAVADVAGGLDAAVDEALEAGAPWVKLYGTAGIGSPPGAGLEPTFRASEVRDAVRRAERAGAGVMVHAWGGTAVDDAIEAGAMSIEHGIFLTEEQARRAAERGMTLVPTLRIYRLVRGMIEAGSLPGALRARVEEALASHPEAVRRARDAGLAIALGTDYGTPDQHGTNAREFDALVAAGLSPEEALIAATRSGAELLARVEGAEGADPDPSRHAGTPVGRIAEGAPADGVILRRDPRLPGALSDPASIAGVLLGGRLLDPLALRAV